MSLSLQAPLLNLPDTFGALFIAGNFAAILFGVTNVQAFVYFQTHRGSGITSLKLVIIGLWTLDALHLAMIIHSVYYYLVIDYANITIVTEIVWSFKLQALFDLVIILIVHLLYAYRIWIVSKGRSRVLPITVGIIVILELGVDIAMLWAIYRCYVLSDIAGVMWVTYTTLGTGTFIDFVIASSLCYFLATSRTGFSSTDSLLTKLMVYTINTGCLTSVCSIAGIITCAVMPQTFIFLGIEFLIAKLYINSFLALLNARHYLQTRPDTVDLSNYHVYRGIYRPELRVNVPQDENLKTSRKNVFNSKHLDEEELRPTRPALAVMSPRPIEMTIEMSSLSSV
ncbi:hypothetical protein K503DRAFT_768518 [Rhizopogon vinicolor AM-OR11-026]|uniref:DUF6534 domain-containing protein n=1 Tax=Rhizopogon vinicolor AM-OR11-026 TaxID=1314800 RepID=A0A1B7N6N8_9AGAM|nr:hypothetical protein K503DRAFT_768518 [Rhizopogon vinicolor AM-OR11-026]